MGSGKGKSRRAAATVAPHRTTAELLKKYPYEETELCKVALAMGKAATWRKALPRLSPFIYASRPGPRAAPDAIHADNPENVLRNILGTSNRQVSDELANEILSDPEALDAAHQLAGRYRNKFDDAFEISDKDNMIAVRGKPGGIVAGVYAALAEGFYHELLETLVRSVELKIPKKVRPEFKPVSF